MAAKGSQPTDSLAADAQTPTADFVDFVAHAKPTGRAEQLLEAGTAHQRPLVLGGQHQARLLQKGAPLPRRDRGVDLHVELDRYIRAAVYSRPAPVDLRLHAGLHRGAILDAVVNRFKAYTTLMQSQPYLADYIRRVYAEGGEESIEFFRMMLESVRAELAARMAAGAAREFEDPDLGLALYCHLVSAQVLIRPQLEAVVGLDLDNPNDIERLNRAQTDLLTRALFSPAPERPRRRPKRSQQRPNFDR
jgi:hypothetical protein